VKEAVRIELLSPAGTPQIGIEAVKHGADAVYIGALRFGARSQAGNDIEGIAELASFAHKYGARVYVTVNTILKDSELSIARDLIWDLYSAGADAVLVQDMAILKMDLPPIALHASTQMHVDSIEKVRFLRDCGFSRVVLARELTLQEITAIHAACPDVELECFVHGSLCVSYSGHCYASEALFGRSANRGCCAQFCRLPFTLTDSEGTPLAGSGHYLSLKDMNRSARLEELIEAGVVSFKIEGRLKDVTYVKNVTAAYSERLNSIISSRNDLMRASEGYCSYTFMPDPVKSFNRGFTDYMLDGQRSDISSSITPKSKGEPMGKVLMHGPGWIKVQDGSLFSNGDGICMISSTGLSFGCRVNRVEGNRLWLYASEGVSEQGLHIQDGMELFRNFDCSLDKTLRKESAVRRIPVDMTLREYPEGYVLSVSDSAGNCAEYAVQCPIEEARTLQAANIVRQLSKLGATIYETRKVNLELDGDRFIPVSALSALRHGAVDNLDRKRAETYRRPSQPPRLENPHFLYDRLTYMDNVYNSEAVRFYREHGVLSVEPAFEASHQRDVAIMVCKHCIKYSMGWCLKHGGTAVPGKEPIYLKSSDGNTFKLYFNCRDCVMTVLNSRL